jgi:hypothetical protein
MKINTVLYIAICILMSLTLQGCVTANCCNTKTKTITIYNDYSIPANTGISTGVYTEVDGYHYVNVAVEFEQKNPAEEPVSLGVMFAHSQNGKLGSRRYFTFDQNFPGMADPQMITVTGKASWHGHPHDKSSYIARLPVMGPFLQVFPFNHHNEARKLSIVLYLTE